jgi:hypothetical protein
MSAAETGATAPANVTGDILSQIDAAESMDDLMALLRG